VRALKRDANERAVTEALRQAGAVVVHVMRAGQPGAPDLFVCWQGAWLALEIKQPSSRKRLSVAQQLFGRRTPIHVVCTVKDALAVLGIGA
jgi:Holliday junction resolvase